MKTIAVIFTLIIPSIVLAADIAGIFNKMTSLVNTIIPLLASVAFAASLYGIVRFIASAGSEEKRSEAKKYVLYGLVGMFIIVAFWGILTVVANTFFGGSIGAPISISGIVPSNPSPSPSPTPPPNYPKLDQIAPSSGAYYGFDDKTFASGAFKTYCLPTDVLYPGDFTMLQIVFASLGVVPGGDIGIKLTSPDGSQTWTSDYFDSSDETITVVAGANYPGVTYLPKGNWTLEITAHKSSRVRLWWYMPY